MVVQNPSISDGTDAPSRTCSKDSALRLDLIDAIFPTRQAPDTSSGKFIMDVMETKTYRLTSKRLQVVSSSTPREHAGSQKARPIRRAFVFLRGSQASEGF